MKIELKAFNIIDSAVMFNRLSTFERQVSEELSGQEFDPQEATLAIYAAPGFHFSWMAGDECVAVGGFVRQRPGVLRTWFAAPDESWANHGRGITEACRAIIQSLLREGHAHRIETVTLYSYEKAWMWYEKIGLVRESVMKRFTSKGQDAVMYVALAETDDVL